MTEAYLAIEGQSFLFEVQKQTDALFPWLWIVPPESTHPGGVLPVTDLVI